MSAKESEVKYGRGQNPNSRANLRPVQPGEKRNPAGRGRQVVSQLIREIGDQVPEGEEESNYRAAVKKMWELAKNGDREAFRFLVERTEGKPRQSVNFTTDTRERVERMIAKVMSDAEAAGEPTTRRQVLEQAAPYDEVAAALLEEEGG